METNNDTLHVIYEIESYIREINNLCRLREREIVARHAITLPQFNALLLLKQEGQMTIGELSHRMSLACSTMTDLVDRMEKNKVVERVRNLKDRRMIQIHLLERGNEMIRQVLEARRQYFTELLQLIPVHQVVAIRDHLNLLHKSMHEQQ
ncbi:DNA-binding transcriptional regulator, MarR family [Seinonella peptonophila]|uniref:DNA-binding transcriptional regulator, MarR family n=1 Tax=Seinonella peptonophila TaxID=112248 RepID=A0A1M4TWA7_9BACL|nr:MarR family transcriptional regulator [Seinonella peptonophila]SHE48748.1 DNA-binding transcriptional regulator, MarR family [Seinonella peptonophila]